MCNDSVEYQGLTYLASPYSHDNPMEKVVRYEAVCKVAGILMARGIRIFSPIAHSHPIEIRIRNTKLTHDFWMSLDLEILLHSKFLYVLTIPGWQESKGVREEINFAREHGIPILLVDEFGNTSPLNLQWVA